MIARIGLTMILAGAVLVGGLLISIQDSSGLLACCPAPPPGQVVVNADQTVIIVWDPDSQTQHFIRQASFNSKADDFGFLIPSPTEPELSESGDKTFGFLEKVTEPKRTYVARKSRSVGCACSGGPKSVTAEPADTVTVLQEKTVAGLNAVVLEATSATALVSWLQEHGYAYSPQVEAWAKPYVESGWKITALKVAPGQDEAQEQKVAASALRMSFKTDRPLFPYREPELTDSAQKLTARGRLLRIYFLSNGRYEGELTKDVPWTGRTAWANQLSPEDRKKTMELLQLPENAGPADMWLTEFEDRWPYRLAPADVYFSLSPDQSTKERPPIVVYVDGSPGIDPSLVFIAAFIVLPTLIYRKRF